MDFKELTPEFFVAEQIMPEDMETAAGSGIRTVINNRPDDESPGQPKSDDLAVAANGLGIAYCHIPVVSGSISDENIEEFKSACRDLQRPVLAFCRTGTRSTSLWALMEAKSLNIETILATAGRAGYDLTALRSRLDSRANDTDRS